MRYLTLILVASTSALASAGVIVTPIGSDAEYVSLIDTQPFVAEGRIGDRAGAATFELDLGPSTAAPAVTEQFNWPNGDAVPFAFAYDSGSNIVTYAVGDGDLLETLTYQPQGTFTDIFIRTRAVNQGSSIALNNLELDGTAIGTDLLAAGNGLDIIRISPSTALADGFELSGNAVMSWDGNPPTQSRLAYQISVVNPVPEPAGLSLLALGAAALLRRRG